MITTIDIRISAGHVNLPIPLSAVIAGSAATVNVGGVPGRKQGVAIDGVAVVVTNPAGVQQSFAATAQGGQWVATVPATMFASAGSARNGVVVEASGKDETGATRTWRLGMGDLVVIAADATTANLGELVLVKHRATQPATPTRGDLCKIGGTWKLYNGTAWEAFGSGGVTDYNDLDNKPQIGGVTLAGDKTAAQLGLVSNANGSAVHLMLNTGEDSEGSYFGVMFDTVGGVLAWSAEQNGPGGVTLGSWELPHNSNGTPKFGTLALTGDIPALAAPSTESSAQGKAADAKLTADFVNSSINAMAAFYLTADAAGNAFATKAALTSATVFYNGGVARTPTKNDYLIVLADESHTTSLGVNPTTRYVYDGSAWAFQYVVNNTSLTQAQVDAINSGITALLVAWLSSFKGTDTSTTLASLITAIGDKVDKIAGRGLATLHGNNGVVAFSTGIQDASDEIALANFDSSTHRLKVSGIGIPEGVYAFTSELPYAKSSAVGTRQVFVKEITAATTPVITLPEIPNGNEVLNCDIAIKNTHTADVGQELQATAPSGGTAPSIYYPNGETITCKAGCVTLVSSVGINGIGWMVVACNNLAIPEPTV